MNLEVAVRPVGNVAVVDMTGRLTLGDSLFRATVKELLESGRKHILLGLNGLTYIDSSGLGELTTCYITARRVGRQVKILNAQRKVHEMLEITGLFKLFESFSDEAEAIRSFGQDEAL